MGVRVIRCTACRAAIAADVVAATGGTCPHCHRPLNTAARHERAVAQTLEWADEAAARGDHANALAWLKTVEAVGDQLTPDYKSRRAQWRTALRDHPAARLTDQAGGSLRPVLH